MTEEIEPQEYGVTPALFLEWRTPRFGDQNPTKIQSQVWEWLVHSKLSGYQSTQKLNGPSAFDAGATWSFDRFGQSVTELPDGRIIYIAGEHEDYYDPDFYIYNDVVVVNPDDSVEFYCYSKDEFPPTDFHSATLLGNKIIIIGNLGYYEERNQSNTQIYLLNLDNFKIEKVNSSGNSPGWIHGHRAVLSADRKFITVTKGKIDLGQEFSLRENIDDWQLDLQDWHWQRLTERNWARWEIKRRDRKHNHLWDLRQALWSLEVKWEEHYQQDLKNLEKELGYRPDVNLIKDIYSFGFPCEQLPQDEDEYNVFRIKIDGVTVRFVEERYSVQATVEGELPDEKIVELQNRTLSKISLLENTICDLEVY
ncbi:hypothetical protein Xen7305DRAFT_00047600 [Xenococcus sp. PCC 7305]|uniref:hypothetical protein n=1 Tax=Xenococcus sp. PCC 7305 TaxID=102125 RepID=UPI0002ACEC89|nr:hypothetical protein [Xenococcus sp. PCC 7305]ELS05021.1 hypothetical protein Xen7305DRAFT_00047600 [Xenococcus sp. PCC 7305]